MSEDNITEEISLEWNKNNIIFFVKLNVKNYYLFLNLRKKYYLI